MNTDEVRIYKTLEEENTAEAQRCGRMTPAERCREFAVVQARQWGRDWTERPIEKIWSIGTGKD